METEKELYRIIKMLKDRPLLLELDKIEILTDALRKGILPKKIIRETAIQILDLSETGIFRSTAADGILGFLNKRNRTKRQDRFWDRMQQDFRKNENNIVAVAEGDSWFEHPFLQDIIDHINRNDDIAVYSLAYGGDWLDNILFEGEYIDMLSIIKPDVFLVSAGGNDLLGDKKIGIMCRGIKKGYVVDNVQNHDEYIYTNNIPKKYQHGLENNEDADDIREGVKYLSKEFFAFLNIMQWQYHYLFTCIRKKYEVMPIFTQSYDYATPQGLIKRHWFSVAYWYQRPINTLMQSGKWIETAMRDAKIYDLETMHKIIKAMLYLFKQMVIETSSKFDYIYHIDSQGLTKPNEWFDEIHIKSHKFLQVGQTYANAIKKSIEYRDAITKQEKPESLPTVYRTVETINTLTFWKSFKAFYAGLSIGGYFMKLLNLNLLKYILFTLIFGILYWFSQSFACKLATILLGIWAFTKIYVFLRAIIMSYKYSRKFKK